MQALFAGTYYYYYYYIHLYFTITGSSKSINFYLEKNNKLNQVKSLLLLLPLLLAL